MARFFDQEALGTRCMPGRMEQAYLDSADLDGVAAFVLRQFASRDLGHLGDAFGFEFVHVYRCRIPFKEPGDPLDFVSEKASADVILMIMRDQGSGDADPVRFGLIEKAVYTPGRIHQEGFALTTAAHEVC